MKQKFYKAIEDLAKDMKPLVDEIENGPSNYQSTKDNYGRYLSAITTMAAGNTASARIAGKALIIAGANSEGVKAAFRIYTGGEL
jgi:hypothetical protein